LPNQVDMLPQHSGHTLDHLHCCLNLRTNS
jgi:hypothetical protein